MAFFRFERTTDFIAWFNGLDDEDAISKITSRLDRLRIRGEWGVSKSVGSGITELIIDHGPGYRIYVKPEGVEVILLLGGGDKTTQRADIQRAKVVARAWQKSK